MFKNPDSAMYNFTYKRNTGKLYSGAVCSSYVCWFTNREMFYTSYDIHNMLIFKDFVDVEDLEIGDVLHQTGHVSVVSGFEVGSDGEMSVLVSEMAKPMFRTVKYTRNEFLDFIEKGEYKIGRFPNQGAPRTMAKPIIVDDCISERGDKTHYKLGSDLWMMIKGETFYVKSRNSDDFVVIDKTTLPTKIGNTTQYNLASIIDGVGIWKFKTELSNDIESQIAIYVPADVVLNVETVKVFNYLGCTPYSYHVMCVYKGENSGGSQEAPSGYTAERMIYDSEVSPQYMDRVTSDEFNINVSKIGGSKVGYYVRVMFETGCGRAYVNSNIHWLNK